MSASAAPAAAPPAQDGAAWAVITLAGVAAAMHVWKLPGVLEQVRADLGMDLLAAGTLLGIVQVASMLLGLGVSLFSDVLGMRRTLVAGLGLLAAGSLLGALSTEPWHLMATRAVEGIGFLLVTVTAPPLIRRSTPPGRVSTAMGFWSAFQGTALLLAVLVSTLLVSGVLTGGEGLDWRHWWIVMGVLTLLAVPPVLWRVPRDPADADADLRAGLRRVGRTAAVPEPWILGVVFGCYTVQWGSVLMFLPQVLTAAQVEPVTAGVATAVVGGLNALGNVATGALLRRGAAPRPLVLTGMAAMAVTTALIYAVDWAAVPGGAWAIVGLAAVFSLVAAAVPASLTRVAVEVAPPGGSPAAVVGLMTQLYNLFNFLGPVLLAAITTAAGGWHMSWTMTVGFAALGAVLAAWVLSPRRLGLDLR